MVAAAKVHRFLQQAPKQGAEQQNEGNALLGVFEEKLRQGLPDEALQRASAAVDLFFKHGDKAGESRALSCIAQAMAAGATIPKSDASVASGNLELGSSILQNSIGAMESQDLEGYQYDGVTEDVVEDNASSSGFTDFTQLPISYGERLVLETCLRCRQRPYDRQRQEQLAQPRRRGAVADAWGVGGGPGDHSSAGASNAPAQAGSSSTEGVSAVSADPSAKSNQDSRMTRQQEDDLVKRLTQPKRKKASASSKPPGESMMFKTHNGASNLKQGGIDIASIVARLAAPRAVRTLSPTPGERVVLMWNRSENLRKPDYNRLSELAKSSRRGGTARAWGVYDSPSSARDWMDIAPQTPPAPRKPESARGAPRPQPAPDPVVRENADPGSPSLEASLPRLEGQATQPVYAENSLPDASQGQDMGHTWHHPWRERSGVDRQA